ncbi:MAG: hypothetical protein M1822_008998 [Bathelium mastoideum]|nr:MAG: hypothetical protein M1822_008998 [Bathelium mastoideum]
MLDRLPAEILSWIIQFINDKSDLTSLSLVSRLLYQHAIPKLYRSITIWAKHKRNLSNLDLRILAHSTKHLQYVKNLQFKTPFQGRFRVHCPRSDYDSDKDFANEYISSSDEDSLSQIQSDDEFEYGLVSEETNQNADYDPSVHTINDEAEATATGKVESGEILKSGTSDTDGQSQVSMSQMFANGKHETFLRDLTSRLLPLFQNINESNLQSFSLTLLHIRPRGWMNLETDGEDRNFRFESDFSEHLPLVKGFANWAFGPNGLPDLRILAYGDFTFGGGHPNILLRRSSNEADFSSSNVMFRELGKADGGLWELVQENADFLEACPEDYLVHQW